jgi:hypothetical protein
MTRTAPTLVFALFASASLALACSNSEAPAEDHTPASLEINGVPVDTSDTVTFTASATDTVQLSFFNAANDNLDDVEAEHYSLLTFTPSTSITATRRASHHFRQDVVVGAVSGQTGDLDIGFGHDTLADEYTLSLHYKVQ